MGGAEAVGIKWQVVRMEQIPMGPQSPTEQLGPDGWAMEPLECFEQV